ncbi:Single-stranded DNA-binding protein [bioreactor metagenome]|uniref:Single-stranded DNA-binding protein n=1 Tax=bioreactor metagenome TaxID=1076179 RepID=A0A644WZP6_9ZZZZ
MFSVVHYGTFRNIPERFRCVRFFPVPPWPQRLHSASAAVAIHRTTAPSGNRLTLRCCVLPRLAYPGRLAALSWLRYSQPTGRRRLFHRIMPNKIILMGHLTRDPELRRTGSGMAVTGFTLAVDRDFKSQNGEKETNFIDIVAWRSTAEFVSKYFTKGRMAVVKGRLQFPDWTDRQGNKRCSAEVVADNMYFGDSKKDVPNSGTSSLVPY